MGNDRIVALVSASGITVRQDEGGPKLLNGDDAKHGQFRGGRTWIVDTMTNTVLVDTSMDTAANSTQQVLGVGYYNRSVSNTTADLMVQESFFVPFGDVPLLVATVTVTNQGSTTRQTLATAMYFGGQMHQFAQPGYGVQCSHSFTLAQTKADDDHSWVAQGLLHFTHPPTGSPAPPGPAPGRWQGNGLLNDVNPRPTFLVALSAGSQVQVSVGTDGTRLFPAKATAVPHFPLDGLLNTTGPQAVQSVALPLPALGPGESATVYFVYGYLPLGAHNDTEAAQAALVSLLQAHVPNDPATMFSAAQQAWRLAAPMRFSVKSMPWVEREVLWHGYMLRSMLTYDEFFQEPILNQAGQCELRLNTHKKKLRKKKCTLFVTPFSPWFYK